MVMCVFYVGHNHRGWMLQRWIRYAGQTPAVWRHVSTGASRCYNLCDKTNTRLCKHDESTSWPLRAWVSVMQLTSFVNCDAVFAFFVVHMYSTHWYRLQKIRNVFLFHNTRACNSGYAWPRLIYYIIHACTCTWRGFTNVGTYSTYQCQNV